MDSSFVRSAAIPTQSDARGLQFHSKDSLLFASHTNVFLLQKDRLSLFTSVRGTIRAFAVSESYTLVCGADRLFMMHKNTVIATLRCSASAIDLHERFFVIATGSTIELWEIPREYRFVQFKRLFLGTGHSAPVTFVRFLSGSEVLTCSFDGTVRLSDWRQRKTRILAKTRGKPIGAFPISPEEIAVVSDDGRIVYFRLDRTNVSEEQSVDVHARILCCSASKDGLLAVACEPAAVSKKNSQQENLSQKFFYDSSQRSPSQSQGGKGNSVARNTAEDRNGSEHAKHEKGKRPGACSRTTIVLYSKSQEIYRVDVERDVKEITLLAPNIIAMRGLDFVALLSVSSGTMITSLDIPLITNFTLSDKGNVVACCKDHRIRLYSRSVCHSVLYDPQAPGELLEAHVRQNHCVALYASGRVSLFNTASGAVFRSFTIEELVTVVVVAGRVLSCVSEEGDVFFVASGKQLFVIDLFRSRLVEKIQLDACLISLRFHKGSVFYLDLSGKVARINPFSGASAFVTLESAPSSFYVGGGRVAVACQNEVSVYTHDLNYVTSLKVDLGGRLQGELISRSQPVTALAANSSFLFCGGRSNEIKIIDCPLQPSLQIIPAARQQIVSLSEHSDWQGYRYRLGKGSSGKSGSDISSRVIEACRIEAVDGRFLVLSREGIQVYEVGGTTFSPLKLSVEATPEFIEASLASKKVMEALVAALELGDRRYVERALLSISEPREAARAVPAEYMQHLNGIALEVLRANPRELQVAELLKWIAVEHGVADRSAAEEMRQLMRSDYELLRDTSYLIKALSEQKGK